MRSRVAELEALRVDLARRRPDTGARIRKVAQALYESGASFGFPRVSTAGALLEDATEESVTRRMEGVIHVLREVAWAGAEGERRPYAWLSAVAPGAPSRAASIDEAWQGACAAIGVPESELARRVAAAYRVQPPEVLLPSRAALRLVQREFALARLVVPLDEDGRGIRVATANPVDVLTEAEIHLVSGRTPLFVVAPPAALRAVLGAPPETAPHPGPEKAASPAQAPVLLVDDDPSARVIATAVLRRKEYPVVEASDGAEAFRLFQANPEIRLAVVDLEMPGMGGAELVRRLRASARGPQLAIVVLTGSREPEAEADLLEAGADDYIQKPLDPRLFLARVSAALRRTQAPGFETAEGAGTR